MGLDDLVGGGDDDDNDKEKDEQTKDKPGSSPKDWMANGEDRYFNKTSNKRKGILDRIRDEIEIDGEQRNSHTLYVTISTGLKFKDGVIYNSRDEMVVDVNGNAFRVDTKELKMMYGDKSQQVLCYEIRVR